MRRLPNKITGANRRPAAQSDGSDNLAVIVADGRAFPAAWRLSLGFVRHYLSTQ